MSRRKLTEPEKEIWDRVARTVSPRRAKGAKPEVSRQDFAAMMRVQPDISSVSKSRPQSLDMNQDKKVRRGRVKIEMTIDLHDLTQAQAYPALISGLVRASNRNMRCTLVITGKGARLEGVLRRSLSGWLAIDPIRPLIASYAQAHIRHGGSGAWYVFLKRTRAKE